jgi:hypothetical protein
MEKGKTSTFIIHHDRCDPSKWTPGDVLTLAKFVRDGDLRHAAILAGLGVQLVTSEYHMPVGGTLMQIGWSQVVGGGVVDGLPEDLMDVLDGEDIAEIAPIYRGPSVYGVAIPMGDADGNYEGSEYETVPTLEAARAYLVPEKEETHGE